MTYRLKFLKLVENFTQDVLPQKNFKATFASKKSVHMKYTLPRTSRKYPKISVYKNCLSNVHSFEVAFLSSDRLFLNVKLVLQKFYKKKSISNIVLHLFTTLVPLVSAILRIRSVRTYTPQCLELK